MTWDQLIIMTSRKTMTSHHLVPTIEPENSVDLSKIAGRKNGNWSVRVDFKKSTHRNHRRTLWLYDWNFGKSSFFYSLFDFRMYRVVSRSDFTWFKSACTDWIVVRRLNQRRYHWNANPFQSPGNGTVKTVIWAFICKKTLFESCRTWHC